MLSLINPSMTSAGRRLLETSVVVDLARLEPDVLPRQIAISAITLAELSAGPNAATDPAEAARRQERLQRAEATFEVVPFGPAEARAYGRIYAAVRSQGRQPRRRLADLLVAATAMAEGVPIITRNPDDFVGLETLVEVIQV